MTKYFLGITLLFSSLISLQSHALTDSNECPGGVLNGTCTGGDPSGGGGGGSGSSGDLWGCQPITNITETVGECPLKNDVYLEYKWKEQCCADARCTSIQVINRFKIFMPPNCFSAT